jgi:hypothetical protein
MPPERADFVLTADIPNVKLHVLISHAFDVESDGGNGGDILVQLQFI